MEALGAPPPPAATSELSCMAQFAGIQWAPLSWKCRCKLSGSVTSQTLHPVMRPPHLPTQTMLVSTGRIQASEVGHGGTVKILD